MNTRARRAGVGHILPHSWLFVFLLSVVVLVAGCADAPNPPQPTATHTTTARSTAACSQSSDQSPVPMSQVWGKVSVRKLPRVLANNYIFIFEQAATPDGQWLVGNSVPRDFPNNGTTPSYLVLRNVATGQVQTIAQLLTPQSQVDAASSDGEWVVWTEFVGITSTSDWTLRAYNRATRQLLQLAQVTKNAQGQPALGPVPSPVVDHGIVVWSQGLGPVGPQTLSNAVVREEDLSTGAVRTLATSATYVTMSWPWAAWAQVESSNSGVIQFKNLLSGQTARLNDQPSYLVLQGTSTAYVDKDGSLNLIDDVTRDTPSTQPLAYPTEYFDFPSISDRLIGWNQNSAAVVYDRLLRCFVALPLVNSKISATFVSPHLLYWEDAEPAVQQQQDDQAHLEHGGTIYIIDTSSLPKSVSAG